MAKTKKKNKDKKKKKSENKNDGEILLEFIKSPKAKVVVEISEYKGKNYFQIKEMWRTDDEAEADSDDWKYSKKIISFPMDAKEGKTSVAEKFSKKLIKALKRKEW